MEIKNIDPLHLLNESQLDKRDGFRISWQYNMGNWVSIDHRLKKRNEMENIKDFFERCDFYFSRENSQMFDFKIKVFKQDACDCYICYCTDDFSFLVKGTPSLLTFIKEYSSFYKNFNF